MSHFAEIDRNGVVLRVIVVDQAFIDSGVVGNKENWIQTHKDRSARKHFASVGSTYDSGRNAFIHPKPFDSWTLNEDTAEWETSKALPADYDLPYWDEVALVWKDKATE